MSKPVAVASVVGGLVLAIGMLLIPFRADPAGWAVTVGDGTETVTVGGDCGTLLSHYLSGPAHDACEPVAVDRAWMVAAGVVVAALGGWSLLRLGRGSRL